MQLAPSVQDCAFDIPAIAMTVTAISRIFFIRYFPFLSSFSSQGQGAPSQLPNLLLHSLLQLPCTHAPASCDSDRSVHLDR